MFTMGLCGSVVYFLNAGGSVFTMGLCGDLLFIFRTRVDAVFTMRLCGDMLFIFRTRVDAVFTMGMCVYGILWFRSTTFYSSSDKKAPRKKKSRNRYWIAAESSLDLL